MPAPPRRPAALVGKVFPGRYAITRGLLTKSDLRSSAWRPLFRGVYADVDLPVDHRRRALAAGWFLLPPAGAIAGRSAAYLHGVTLADTEDPVEVVVPAKQRFGPVAGLRIHLADVADDEIRVIAETRVTRPARTCFDLARWLDVIEAVVYLDAMMSRGLITAAQLHAYAEAHRHVRGWRKLQRAVALADPGAASPPESRLRVRLVLAGLPPPVTQYIITRDGMFVARVDLAWPEYRVVVEYDGEWHAGDPAQIHRDRRRLNRILGTDDWLVLHVTAHRLRADFDGVLAEIRAALNTRRPR